MSKVDSPTCSTKEFLHVLKSMKSDSAPGPSTENKALYLFLFDILPNFTTRALNKIYNIDIENSPFKSLKNRNVIFIPKKDCDLNDIKSFRPISLLEFQYKILSKALCRKVSPHLNKILHCDQFAGIKNRHMSTASISTFAVLNHIKDHDIQAQLISFDIKSALRLAKK